MTTTIILLEIFVLIILIFMNGLLSMTEIAFLSSRKTKLQVMLDEGKKSAQIVIDLTEDPNQFLSTIQIGITLISILTGAFGGATLSYPLASALNSFAVPYADVISIIIVVLITTYLSLIVGELVPKRIGLNNPEVMAVKVAKLMKYLSKICGPLVTILSKSTEAILFVIGIRNKEENVVTEEEIEMMIEEGRAGGTIEKEEEDIIKRVFRLDAQKVDMIMTPRSEIVWIDLDDEKEEMYEKIIESKRSIFPVAKDELDDFIGVVQAKDILSSIFRGEKVDIEKTIKEPLIVPTNVPSLELLKQFKKNSGYVHMALIVDEFGSLEGLITLNDLLEGIVGDIPGIDETDDPIATKRSDGSWLVDGRYPIDRLKEDCNIPIDFPNEKEDNFSTIAGFILSYTGKIPETGEKFDWENYSFEIVDMDGHQIDKVLINHLPDNQDDSS
ncbi:hemolysin family protein [Methanobrevibacter sp. DSM 116169]|uniref:hemolysin family protein n=1 Tax=Methanobrevibacter sp. DSM 116169 TaxID=3242727 RepID=UPI0038FC7628